MNQPAYLFHRGDALAAYESWPTPVVIVSDGAYGVRGFHGDTTGVGGLLDWYRPHVEAWSRCATPATTLWFWNTEVGWATVHPLLVASGWDYVQVITWDKGVAHIAGNVNGKTIRRFPVATEVCAFYQRRFEVQGVDGLMPVQQWLRNEWQRSGLSLTRANEACGVRNAATRKYLTQDWLWYWPPGEMIERLAAYANEHGAESGWPYYSLDGQAPVTGKDWDALRHKWRHVHGITNVWPLAPLHGVERIKGTMKRAAPRVYNPSSLSAAHLNQKPLQFMRRILSAVTDPATLFGSLLAALPRPRLLRWSRVVSLASRKLTMTSRRLQPSASTMPVPGGTQKGTNRRKLVPGWPESRLTDVPGGGAANTL